jgi:hypothetical protein
VAIEASSLRMISPEELKEWAGIRAAPSVSIFMPTDRRIAEPGNNSLKFKALLHRARKKLEERKFRRPEISELLQPLEDLVNDRDFWFHQLNGLALLRTPDRFNAFRVPVTLEEQAYVGDSPVIRPLIEAVTSLGEYYVLALSQNKIRLLQCTMHDSEELDLSAFDIPLNKEEALRWHDLQKPDLNYHITTKASGAHRPQVRGAGDVDEKVHIYEFFHLVDSGMREILKGKRVPLILAGVEFLHPIYREASHYDFILARGVVGNPDELRPDELHEKANPIFKERIEQAFRAMEEKYGDLSSHGGSSNRLADILKGAEEGRVDSLFIAKGRRVWGTFDPANSRVEVNGDEPAFNTDVELLDLAARRTILASGAAYLLPEDRVPGGGDISAIFRY